MNHNDVRELSKIENIDASNGSFLKSALKFKDDILAGVKTICRGIFNSVQLEKAPEFHRGNANGIQSTLQFNPDSSLLNNFEKFSDISPNSRKSALTDGANIPKGSHDYNVEASTRRDLSIHEIHSNNNWFSTNNYHLEPQASRLRYTFPDSNIPKEHFTFSPRNLTGNINSGNDEVFLRNNEAPTSISEITLNSDRMSVKDDRFSDYSNASYKPAVSDLDLVDDSDMEEVSCLPSVVLNQGNQPNDEYEWIPSAKSKFINQIDKPSNDVEVVESELSPHTAHDNKFDNVSVFSSEHLTNFIPPVLVNDIHRFALDNGKCHTAKQFDKNKSINEIVALCSTKTSADVMVENRILHDFQDKGKSTEDFTVSQRSNELRCKGFQFEQKVYETTGKKANLNIQYNLFDSCYKSGSLPQIPNVPSERTPKVIKNSLKMANNYKDEHPINYFNEIFTKQSRLAMKRPISSDFNLFHIDAKRLKFDANLHIITNNHDTQTFLDIIHQNRIWNDLQDKGEIPTFLTIPKESNKMICSGSQFGPTLHESIGKEISSSGQDKYSNFRSTIVRSSFKINSLPTFPEEPCIQSVTNGIENAFTTINNVEHQHAIHKIQSPMSVQRSTSSGSCLFQNEKRPKKIDSENQKESLVPILLRTNIPLELDVVRNDNFRDNDIVSCELPCQNMNYGGKESTTSNSILNTNSSRNCISSTEIESDDTSKNRKLAFHKKRLIQSSFIGKDSERNVKEAKKFKTEIGTPLILRRPARITKSIKLSVANGGKRQTNELKHGAAVNASDNVECHNSPVDVPNVSDFSLKDKHDSTTSPKSNEIQCEGEIETDLSDKSKYKKPRYSKIIGFDH